MGEEFTGVVDRFEGDQAVILLEADGGTVDEVVLTRSALPADGDRVDAILRIVREGDEIREIEFDAEESKRRKESVNDQFDRLSERPD
ncbi:DUF3006 domain-containing protein [Halodesulfurarchaeum formicicum]|uniref:DUF3006 domain-containing protein n=1 Tax=Halodesulfurarchaeum formicicum TaxID=1873524 RepID=A0A1J1ACS1_9EURY|nr:DUF3006 domain-containing protein [Halodesulfurarchaeum formicicum]APE95685.1 hypothetical protein HSR6_1238 [Halodesulfurarchaeum formicicum]